MGGIGEERHKALNTKKEITHIVGIISGIMIVTGLTVNISGVGANLGVPIGAVGLLASITAIIINEFISNKKKDIYD